MSTLVDLNYKMQDIDKTKKQHIMHESLKNKKITNKWAV